MRPQSGCSTAGLECCAPGLPEAAGRRALLAAEHSGRHRACQGSAMVPANPQLWGPGDLAYLAGMIWPIYAFVSIAYLVL